jgi:hypothetical protein
MPDVRALNEKCGVALKQKLVNQQAIVPQSNLVGEQVAVCRVLISRLTISRRRAKAIAGDAGVVKVNPSVVKRAKQTDGNLHPADLMPLSGGYLTNGQRLKPRVMK